MKRKKQISPLINTDERVKKKSGKKEESIYRGSMRMPGSEKPKAPSIGSNAWPHSRAENLRLEISYCA
jgi:hypothetical protein